MEEKELNEISEEELNEVAGGGTYTRDNYLKTTNFYSCEHFECRSCGKRGEHYDIPAGQENFSGHSPAVLVSANCSNCKWHSTLRCNNPINKRS